eukprot:7413782-Pyramimonas_sp.AAC.1
MDTEALQDVIPAVQDCTAIVAVHAEPVGETEDSQKEKIEPVIDPVAAARLGLCVSLLQKNLKHTWASVRKNAPCWAFFIPTVGNDETQKESKTQSITCLLCKTRQDGFLPESTFPTEGPFALSADELDVQKWLPEHCKEGKYVIEYNSRHSTAKLTWHLSACHKHVWEPFLQLHNETCGVKRNHPSTSKSLALTQAGGNPDGLPGTKFRGDLTMESLRAKVAHFAAERDWDQFHTPRNLMLALVRACACMFIGSTRSWERGCTRRFEVLRRYVLGRIRREREWVGEVGELSEIFQWRGEVARGLPGQFVRNG